MQSLVRYLAPPGPCSYLPGETWRLEYELVGAMSPAEYMARMRDGWRRFGFSVFRPQCPTCTQCRSIRVPVETFRPNRSQRRCRALNESSVRLKFGKPRVDDERLRLYDLFHAYQSETKGWPEHEPKDAGSYIDSFVRNPFATQEWTYYLGDRLIGCGYVDDLPGGLSAIYFFYDPDERERSLGTWNVLCTIEVAAMRSIPFVYLGFFVAGSRSLEYKANFAPNQIRMSDGQWRDFRG